MKKPKITNAGSGNVGATAAHLTLLKALGDAVLYDIVKGIHRGKALDQQESAPVEGFDCLVVRNTHNKSQKGGRFPTVSITTEFCFLTAVAYVIPYRLAARRNRLCMPDHPSRPPS
ncbi:hypothetical protein G8C92_19685 [Paenibacillus donghaensis]|nr:hypothetical protein [Paenibacillus donghaensis]